LLRNIEHFYHARQLLEDETSRALYDQLILLRILGHLHVQLSLQDRGKSCERIDRGKLASGRYEDIGAFGPFSIFLVPGGDEILVKGWKDNVTVDVPLSAVLLRTQRRGNRFH
jgi:hypothetical protein